MEKVLYFASRCDDFEQSHNSNTVPQKYLTSNSYWGTVIGMANVLNADKEAVALHFAYYNFVKRHNTLRCTPAMAAGVANSFWSVGDLVEAAA